MLRVVGAGLGRTGTRSLKLALERLLGAPCYHMVELKQTPSDGEVWLAALRGEPVEWRSFLDGYAATVDWPAVTFWRELAATWPDAHVLLSTRADAASWLRSARATIMPLATPDWHDDPDHQTLRDVDLDMFARFDPDWRDDDAAMAAYDRHNAAVRAEVEPGRLVEWQPGDGWGPLCAALDLPVPDEPFPHVNSTAEFNARAQARTSERTERAQE